MHRGATSSATETVAASIFYAGYSLTRHWPLPLWSSHPANFEPEGGQLGLLQCQQQQQQQQQLVDSGSAECLLVALTRRCDTLEAQNAVLRTKVLQLYPPGERAGLSVYWVAWVSAILWVGLSRLSDALAVRGVYGVRACGMGWMRPRARACLAC